VTKWRSMADEFADLQAKVTALDRRVHMREHEQRLTPRKGCAYCEALRGALTLVDDDSRGRLSLADAAKATP
jgi:hypothetical protein